MLLEGFIDRLDKKLKMNYTNIVYKNKKVNLSTFKLNVRLMKSINKLN